MVRQRQTGRQTDRQIYRRQIVRWVDRWKVRNGDLLDISLVAWSLGPIVQAGTVAVSVTVAVVDGSMRGLPTGYVCVSCSQVSP